MNVKRMNIGERQVLIQCDDGQVFVVDKEDVSIRMPQVVFHQVPARRKFRVDDQWQTESEPSVRLIGMITIVSPFIYGAREPNAEGKIELQEAA